MPRPRKTPAPSKPKAPPAAPKPDANAAYSARLSALEDRVSHLEKALRAQLNLDLDA